MTTDWEDFLRARFPGFLLPQSEQHRVTEASARAFLENLGLPGRDLIAFRTISLLAGHSDALHDFACYWLPELVRVLPSRSAVEQRVWRGGYQGRLDTRATLARHMSGERDAFVTRTRHRDFNLPENVFVRSLAGRTLRLLEQLQQRGLLHGEGWTRQAVQSLASLRILLESTGLREIEETPADGHQLHAATHARHPAFRCALQWFELLHRALDTDDPERLAAILRDGALRPMDKPKRFEVAVLITLLEAINARLPETAGWEVTRDLIAPGRNAIASFKRDNAAVTVFYDQAVLPPTGELGPRDRGVAHYFGSSGRLRPDITVRTQRADGSTSYVVFEVKLTDDPSYVASGFGEAIVYRHEYAPFLLGWPEAVVVTSYPVDAAPRRQDDVVAVNWAELDDSGVVEGVLAGVL